MGWGLGPTAEGYVGSGRGKAMGQVGFKFFFCQYGRVWQNKISAAHLECWGPGVRQEGKVCINGEVHNHPGMGQVSSKGYVGQGGGTTCHVCQGRRVGVVGVVGEGGFCLAK